jgi:hypothetical protein
MKVLILYCINEHPIRITIRDHLTSFWRYSSAQCSYVNMAVRRLPRAALRLQPDVVVFDTTFLSFRCNRPRFRRLMEAVAPIAAASGRRIAVPQDEMYHTDLLCEFIERLGVTEVYSCAGPEDWRHIYAGIDPERVRFQRVMPGYLADHTLARIEALSATTGSRDVDISYRAWHAQPWLGRHGIIKADIAGATAEAARAARMRTDISTRAQDTLHGEDWLRLLLRSRYTIGVEGGASIHDRDGSISTRTDSYMARHPEATFEEIEAACFPGMEGTLSLRAISPRHLEACATRTGQILVEGEYNGVLEAGRHYLPLRVDFGNLDEVLEVARDERLRTEITETAHAEVVASGRYGYRAFVATVLGENAADGPPMLERRTPEQRWLAMSEAASWPWVAVRRRGRDALRGSLRAARGARRRSVGGSAAVRP